MNKKVSILLQIIFFAAFLVLLAGIIFGITKHDIMAEGSIMLSVFWGQFTFLDIYVSFLVFYLWTLYRDKSILKSIFWFLMIMIGGSMSICLYLFLAVRAADENWNKLLQGKRWNKA